MKFEYSLHNFQDLFPLLQKRKADVAFASASVNEEREKIVDFSHPTVHSGLHILLSKNRRDIHLMNTIKAFFSEGYRQLLKPIFALLCIIFIFANMLWFFERSGGDFIPTYIPGIFQSFWLSLCVIIGTDGGFFLYNVFTWPGRILITIGQVMNLAVLGLFVGELTAFITTRKIRSNIESPEDLQDHTVATVRGTTSESCAKQYGAKVISVTTIDEAYKKLRKNSVDAVVFDAPVLRYFSRNSGGDWSEVVGEVFQKQDCAFMLRNDSVLRKDVNLALLVLHENGSYDALQKKWFGERE